jgi:hypothetical protein
MILLNWLSKYKGTYPSRFTENSYILHQCQVIELEVIVLNYSQYFPFFNSVFSPTPLLFLWSTENTDLARYLSVSFNFKFIGRKAT